MPRFPVNFRRKSTVTDEQNGPVEPSFRVLDRSDVGKSFDGGVRMMKASGTMSRTTLADPPMDDNLFADMKNNRGSGSSNTTKATSDNSSRHSNASTAPSSTDYAAQEDWRASSRKPIPLNDGAHPAPPKPASNSFLKNAGRTFSFGGSKKNLPTIPADEQEPVPSVPSHFEPQTPGGRSRAPTASTVTTATPPQVENRDFMLDLGGDLSNVLSAFSKRTSVATVKDESGRPVLASRNLTTNRASQPSPLHLDHSTAVEPPPKSWNSHRSDEGLLNSRSPIASPPPMAGEIPPPVPRHTASPMPLASADGEDVGLLKDTVAATRYLAHNRHDEDTVPSLKETYARPSRHESKHDEENMFDTSFSRPRFGTKQNTRPNGQPRNKVMTPAEFEKYRQDKVRQSQSSPDKNDSDNEDDDTYEDEEDDREKTKELAKQRQKQEAHMTVYRQQMMKVTGEQSGASSSRPGLGMSLSTPNLLSDPRKSPNGSQSPRSDGSSDEEVPLAILAAHGFPSKNRPPTRLSNVGSNPNLRGVNQPSYVAGPGSVSGDTPKNSGGHLPAFARKLPQDPFLGAGLINQPPRESFALAGGVPATPRAAPVGGLVGVIANEERSRAMRRGSPAVDHGNHGLPPQMQMPMNGFDPMAQIPPQMMYPPPMPMLTPGDQAQIQMTQQMQQFMQMQMQFMQMMAGQNQGQMPMQAPPGMGMGMGMGMPGQAPSRPASHMPTQSMSSVPEAPRGSFLGDPMSMGMGNGMGLEPPRGDSQMRTMSMVQPSSASWIQPPQSGYTPSIRMQGGGYAPSIAPSERSNIGLPGRYRPVSSINPLGGDMRSNTMSGALPTLAKLQPEVRTSPLSNENDEDDDDEEGWEAMKAKRAAKKSSWRTKKNYGSDIGALIS
ncbi:hypothetical protein JX265_007842 [Neoarthrinium moseri]|uniref:Uncharacterized protein n=1 Tax=Neoarthrinium moseri TaxID=1658444 RepID=A0A9Q0APG3_9PEZI|nr:uncharacterized protein JN550_003422 [Neoarthrinium moseri]KAI1866541.1 hypothetical protein JX265_007842 [Neoarthrinium moseri]KAI1873169.1 hypothetical protein JN550_003422 [Neoarthrinium moseri]